MNIFFDMDHTILEADSGYIRPGIKELFERLRADGHTLYIWSGNGVRMEEVKLFRLQDMVSGVFAKPVRDYERTVREMLARKEIPVRPDLVVDDSDEIVDALGGIAVRAYGPQMSNDREMERVYRIICECRSQGYSLDSAFRRKPSGE